MSGSEGSFWVDEGAGCFLRDWDTASCRVLGSVHRLRVMGGDLLGCSSFGEDALVVRGEVRNGIYLRV